jgi:hypothetical protein
VYPVVAVEIESRQCQTSLAVVVLELVVGTVSSARIVRCKSVVEHRNSFSLAIKVTRFGLGYLVRLVGQGDE